MAKIQPFGQPVFFNTLTKREEVFVPRNPGVVRFFTCGPSVYQKQHLGNYRTFIFEDVLQKYLEYLGYKVERAINFTDVEDKAVDRVKKENITLDEITAPNIQEFKQTASDLKIFVPSQIPRATESVDQAVSLIQSLLDSGTAYWHNGNVYFDPLKYSAFGEVYGLDMSKWPKKKVRFSKDTYRGMRWNLGDFILWHGHRDEEPVYWDTALGRGRPAWNVQDPAMITKTLGFEIDIHAGGIDNKIRHHDYNRAVVESVTGKELAHYWMHCEHLIVEGEKMSKSKGNTLYPEDAYKRGCTPSHVRFMLMNCHYQEKLNITKEHIDQYCEKYNKLLDLVTTTTEAATKKEGNSVKADNLIREIPILFKTKMNNNLHIDQAINAVTEVLEDIKKLEKEERLSNNQVDSLVKELREIDHVLNFLFS